MELSQKEKMISLVALRKYMDYMECQLESDTLDEESYADLVNDLSLLEIVIYKFEQDIK